MGAWDEADPKNMRLVAWEAKGQKRQSGQRLREQETLVVRWEDAGVPGKWASLKAPPERT
jgi:tRNA(Leu) C34 or U34 (ribose-2'-O)-methylase TrmL